MSRPVQTISPETAMADAASLCDQEAIGSVVVIEDTRPIGIVTSADFVKVLGNISNPGSHAVAEFMSSPVTTIQSEATLGEAVDTMYDNDISRLVVIEDESLVGLISTDDIAETVPQILHRSELTSTSGKHRYRVRPGTAYEHDEWTYESMASSDRNISVGDRVEFGKAITEQDVRSFAALSGDTNRLHLDEEYASGTRFGQRIVHGTLVSSLISAALARLPGVTIYVSQDLSFLAPVDIGESVTAVCEIVKEVGRNKYLVTTDVVDSSGTRVIEGQAVVLIDAPPEEASIEIEAIS
ncbi:CBS domain-containing protein [Haloarcula sp. S1AR25-5A]|uniref:CBS domain-containing protein n=1 Tax=Haloarcula terrestris TaxID=2950533 RepID=A0AAE4JKI2_9EURY|nr:CBS domain-containing protein [Haloarcula terrestris]MDS0223369.1 CBS domain-containing protein [Haloarcula terrestris]